MTAAGGGVPGGGAAPPDTRVSTQYSVGLQVVLPQGTGAPPAASATVPCPGDGAVAVTAGPGPGPAAIVRDGAGAGLHDEPAATAKIAASHGAWNARVRRIRRCAASLFDILEAMLHHVAPPCPRGPSATTEPHALASASRGATVAARKGRLSRRVRYPAYWRKRSR